MRYMKNKSTGCVFPFDQKAIEGNADLAECTAAGTILGRDSEGESVFYSKIAALRSEVADKDLKIAQLESENRELHAAVKMLEKQIDPEGAKREELKEYSLNNLRKVASEMGIETDNLTRSQITDAIICHSAKEK